LSFYLKTEAEPSSKKYCVLKHLDDGQSQKKKTILHKGGSVSRSYCIENQSENTETTTYKKQEILIYNICFCKNSKGFWWWYIIISVTGFLDFIHQCFKQKTFQKLDLSLSSKGKVENTYPIGSIRANLNHWTSMVSQAKLYISQYNHVSFLLRKTTHSSLADWLYVSQVTEIALSENPRSTCSPPYHMRTETSSF
jgi:hypothetical protein